MTVHMVRVCIQPPKGEAETAVNNWVENHNEWESDPVSHTLTEVQLPSGDSYVRGDYRFIQDRAATDLLDALESRLQAIQDGLWYRIGYHACDHDEAALTACKWEQTRENGTVPSGVPSLS